MSHHPFQRIVKLRRRERHLPRVDLGHHRLETFAAEAEQIA